jgi:PIN domain nuclease of toxin-antitoxin system
MIAWIKARLPSPPHFTIGGEMPSWLQGLAAQLRTIAVTPAIADTAVALPSAFRGDPADRLIYATAIENGLNLVTKDRAIRDHDGPRSVAIW